MIFVNFVCEQQIYIQRSEAGVGEITRPFLPVGVVVLTKRTQNMTDIVCSGLCILDYFSAYFVFVGNYYDSNSRFK